jgi:mutator protein MutT
MPGGSSISVAVAVVESGGQYLIGLRPAGAPLAGLWEFPGGKVQTGESPAEAAVRECREETGLAVAVERLLMRVVHEYEHGELEIHFFACSPLEGCIAEEPFRWVSRVELPKFEFPAANRALLEMLSTPPTTDLRPQTTAPEFH